MPDPEHAPAPISNGWPHRLLVIGLCAALVLATLLVVKHASPESTPAASTDGVTGQQRSGLTPPADQPSQSPATSAPVAGGSAPGQVPTDPDAALAPLLNGRATALLDGDRTAWLAGVLPTAKADSTSVDPASADPVAARFRTAQGQVFDRVRPLHPASWSYQVAGGYTLPVARRTALGGSAWLADVQLDYQLVTGGPRVRRQLFLTVVGRAGQWLLAGDTDGATGRDVWDLGPITHAEADRCLVVGSRTRRSQVLQLASECGTAARTVDGAWGRSWPRRTVLTVPGTLTQLATLLGSTAKATNTAGLEQTAAVTIGPAQGAADEVVINGSAFAELSALGRRVVLTHELVHVATRATGSRSAPTWLAEGYADQVAYAATGLAAAQVAGEALAEVRAGRMPSALPAPDDFNAAGDQAAAAYGRSWVAVGLIAEKTGRPAGLKAFYQQAAAGGADPDATLNAALAAAGLGGTTAFVTVWQARLRKLA